MDDPESQVEFLRQKLTEEREDRLKTEKEACKILRGIRKKYDSLLRDRDHEISDMRSAVSDLQSRNQEVVDELTDLKNRLTKSQHEVKKMEKSSPPRTPVRAAGDPSPVKSASKPKNADLLDSLASEIADLKRHNEAYKQQLEEKQTELHEATNKQTITRNINMQLREEKRGLSAEIAVLRSQLSKATAEAEARASEHLTQVEVQRDELKNKVRELEQELSRCQRKCRNLNESITNKEDLIKCQSAEISELKEKCEKYRAQKAQESEREKTALLEELNNLRKDLNQKSRDLELQTSTATELKKACTEIEEQADKFDHLLSKKTEEYDKILQEKKKLEVEKEGLRREITSLKQQMCRQKESHERQVAEMASKATQLEENLAAEVARVRSLKTQILEERSKTEVEHGRVRDLQEQLQQCIAEADSAEQTSERLKSEIREIKEEAARHISEVFSSQATINSLKSSLAHANYKVQSLEERIESLLAQMEKDKLDADTEMYRLSERLRQHHDLENEMMAKIEKLEKTKKPLIGISPRCKSVPRSAGHIRDVRDLDYELSQEKENSRKLHQQLMQAETEIEELKMSVKMKAINEPFASRPANPSAPPFLTTGSPNQSMTSSDNNVDATSDDETEDDGYQHHVVTVDVHHGSSVPRSLVHRRREFSFTDSILEEIESDSSPKQAKVQCTK